jgi:hypothetical protein
MKMSLNSNKSSNFSIDEDIAKLDEIGFNLNISSMALGVVNNMITIFVLLHKRLRKRKFNWYLLALTIFEFIFCLTVFTDYIFIKFNKEQIFLHDLNEVSFMVIDYIIHSTDSCSVVLTLLLTIDRLYAIKKPMKIKQFVTNLHAKKLMTLCLFLLISLKTSSFTFCQFNLDNNVHLIYCSLVSHILFNFAPLTFVLILNFVLAKEVYNYYKSKKTIEFSPANSFSRSQLDIHNSSMKKKFDYSIKAKTRFSRSHGDIFPNNSKHKKCELNNYTNYNGANHRITLFAKSHGDITANFSKANHNFHSELNTSGEIMRRFCNNKNNNNNSKTQKSHYIVILASSLWSLLTSFPYYSFITYDSLFKLNFFSNNFTLKTTTIIQIISSILFNSNHFINFFIYFCFNEEFRIIMFKPFIKPETVTQPISTNSSFRKKRVVKLKF